MRDVAALLIVVQVEHFATGCHFTDLAGPCGVLDESVIMGSHSDLIGVAGGAWEVARGEVTSRSATVAACHCARCHHQCHQGGEDGGRHAYGLQLGFHVFPLSIGFPRILFV